MTLPITALILTFNEQQHIARCIGSLSGLVERICIVDSFSTDSTIEMAKALGAEVIQNPWKNYASQFQHGLDSFDIASAWTMRIDADEYLEPDLQTAMRHWFAAPERRVNALYLRRKMVFLGRPITHGFFYPAMMLRIWRSGEGRIEQRWMDEHIIVENAVTSVLGGDLTDENLNDLAWWTIKHIGYAKREAYDIVASQNQLATVTPDMSGSAKRKRWIKNNLYNRLPSGIRSSLYFAYRYLIGLGFLDGKAGFFFHFFQAYWYRTYVDATLFEIERRAADRGMTPFDMLKEDGILS